MTHKQPPKKRITCSDYIDWEASQELAKLLYKDGDYTMSLLIVCGTHFGLRISDLNGLTWEQLLGAKPIMLSERKTGKQRVIPIAREVHNAACNCYVALGRPDPKSSAFAGRKYGSAMTTQWLNRKLKSIRDTYADRIPHLGETENISTHSLRKTFGRRVWNKAKDKEAALVMLSEIFNHSKTSITKRYLGIRQDDINQVFLNL